MSNSKENLEKAIKRAKKMGIDVNYREMQNGFFYMEIISPLNNQVNRTYAFTNCPYSDIENIDEDALLKVIQRYSNHQVWINY